MRCAPLTNLKHIPAALLCLLGIAGVACAQALSRDVAALLAQRDAITNWAQFRAANNISGWTPEAAADVCGWTGIRCNDAAEVSVLNFGCMEYKGGFVEKPVLPCKFAAAGRLAPQLANLSALEGLFLAQQGFTGPLPEAWGAPGAFPNLLKLNIDANPALSSTLPSGWGAAGGASFPALQQLSFSRCLLQGELPAAWGSPGVLPSLRQLFLDFNNLTGTIPTSWGDDGAFPALQLLAVHNNPSLCGPLSGRLPALVCGAYDQAGDGDIEVANQCYPGNTTLRCRLSDAELLLTQKALVTNWAEFSSANGVVGWSDETLADVCTWTGISCDDETFTLDWGCSDPEAGTVCKAAAQGTLSPALGNTSLEILDFSNHAFSGSAPQEWGAPGAFLKLTFMGLGGNERMRGALPSSWCQSGSLPALQITVLSSIGANGTLSSQWTGQEGCAALTTLELGDNQLSGTLPDAWGRAGAWPALTSITLSGNNLTGSIPASWGTKEAFPAIQYMGVSRNPHLCGSVPGDLAAAVCQSTEAEGAVEPLPNQCHPNNTLVCQAPLAAGAPPVQPANETAANETAANETAGGGSSSSSVPVGAIVGGAVGGIAALALLAVLVMRHRMGGPGLRRQATHGSAMLKQETGTDSTLASKLSSLESGCGSELGTGAPLSPPLDPAAFSVVSSGSGSAAGAEAAHRSGAELPQSYLSTGWAAGDIQPPASLAGDPLLSLISTRLATRQDRSSATPSSPTAPSASGLGSDGAPSSTRLRLPAAVQQWEVHWEELTLVRSVGRGSYGRVYLATWRETPVAVKVLVGAKGEVPDDLELPEGLMRQLQQEAGVMCRMRHPHLVSFLGLCTLPACILTEYCARGSVYDVLKQGTRSPAAAAELTWQRRLDIAVGAARGLLYLHLSSEPIVHGDIKSPNILLTGSWEAKLCDFNLSSILRQQGLAADEEGGATNPVWMAPELLQGARPSMASDIFSYGLVLYELLTWQLPWRGSSPYQVRRWTLEGRRPEVPPHEALPGPDSARWQGLDAYCALMRDCWAPSPEQRPSCSEVLARLRTIAEA